MMFKMLYATMMHFFMLSFLREIIELLDIPENITYYLSNVKLILVTNKYFVEINEVIKGLIYVLNTS